MPLGQAPPFQQLAASLFLFALFFALASFVFMSLQTLLPKYRGGYLGTSAPCFPPSYAPRGASIPCGFSGLRMVPVTTGVYHQRSFCVAANPIGSPFVFITIQNPFPATPFFSHPSKMPGVWGVLPDFCLSHKGGRPLDRQRRTARNRCATRRTPATLRRSPRRSGQAGQAVGGRYVNPIQGK